MQELRFIDCGCKRPSLAVSDKLTVQNFKKMSLFGRPFRPVADKARGTGWCAVEARKFIEAGAGNRSLVISLIA